MLTLCAKYAPSHPVCSSSCLQIYSLILQKPKKDHEEKQLVREGRNSLIAFPNASSFSVFSHVRHFVLQSQLCETYNSRLGVLGGQEEGGEGESGDEEEEAKKDEGGKMPVVSLSLRMDYFFLSCHRHFISFVFYI